MNFGTCELGYVDLGKMWNWKWRTRGRVDLRTWDNVDRCEIWDVWNCRVINLETCRLGSSRKSLSSVHGSA